MAEFSFQYPAWFIIFCIIAGIAVSGLLYYNSKQWHERPWLHKLLLATLRALSVSLLAFLLLNPLLRYFKKEIKKPIIVFAQDHSASIISRDSNWVSAYQNDRTTFIQSASEKFDVHVVQFGEEADMESLLLFPDKVTDMNKAFEFVSDQFDPQFLKCIVIATDGIYNTGKNPLYHPLVSAIPVHTILLGDSLQEKDVAIQRVYHNEIIYSGDPFSIQTDIQAYNASGSNIKINLFINESSGWKSLFESTETIKEDGFFINKEIIVPATKPGIIKYKVQCSTIPGERNTRNNSKEFFVEVLDSKKKILLLASSPHPDISAIKEVLLSNKNYEVDVKYIHESISNLENYTLVFLHQIPDKKSGLHNNLKRIESLKIPRVFIIGNQSDLTSFNQSQEVVKITPNNQNGNEAQAIFTKSFSLFTITDELKNKIENLPPLLVPFGSYALHPNAQVLALQKIGKVETNYPLWIFLENQGQKTSVICGEGLWKWKITDYLQSNSFINFQEILQKTTQYISSKEDKRKFRVNLSKRIFQQNDAILFNAELYNDNFEKINSPDANLSIIDQSNTKYDYTFGKKDSYYELNAGSLPAGEYRYTAQTKWNGIPYKVEGRFGIQESNSELDYLVADHNLLRSISQKSEGIAIHKNEFQKLSDYLNADSQSKPVLFQSLEIKALIDLKWIFFLILLLLSTEWFLRRYWGSY
ncbi:MAG: hypothetical protein M3Q56_08095 [Bacteroidota bacterium]|nr:hypothetical protein [Bacteroidota bacterium]